MPRAAPPPPHDDDDAAARRALLLATAIEAPEVLGAKQLPVSRLVTVGGDSKRLRVDAAPGGSSDYPRRTDQWCWYCCHGFDTPPLPLPIRHDDRRDVFHVKGTFCSWSCMKAYNLESTSYMKAVCANILTLFHRRCTGQLRGIRPAPPRHALRVFGGTMTIDEFRAASGKPLEYCVLPPRMVLHHHVIQETRQAAAGSRRAKPAPDLAAQVDFKDVATKNETLRLKRPKPLQNNRNLLERTMGLSSVLPSATL